MGVDKPNYTQIPNLLLDDLLMLMTDAEMKVTLAIARRTFGYHRDTVELSLSQLQEITHLSRQGVINGINAGIERGTITRTDGKRGGFVYELAINGEHPAITSQPSGLVNEVDYSTSQRSRPPLVNQVDQTSQRSRPPLVNQVDLATPTLKKVLKKDLKKEERKRESVHPRAKPSHDYFDPRKFIAGKVPAGTGATPAEVFYEVHTLKDDRQVLSSHALATITEQVDDLARWRTVVSAWELNSFKATNVQGQLDWYRDGIPQRASPAAEVARGSSPRRGAEKNMSIMDQFEEQFGDMEINPQ